MGSFLHTAILTLAAVLLERGQRHDDSDFSWRKDAARISLTAEM